MSMEPLGKLLHRQMQAKPGMTGPMQTVRVIETAVQMLAECFPSLAVRLTVVSFRGGALTVHAASGAAAAELRLRESQVLAELRERVGAGTVRAIRYRL